MAELDDIGYIDISNEWMVEEDFDRRLAKEVNSMGARESILVTGGTGRQGGTGRVVVEQLIKRDFAVRALVRGIDERSDHLKRLGAEIVVGDFGDYASMLTALDGIKSAYFCYPVGPGISEAAGLFATAGREQGLKRIVDLSLASSRPDSPSPQGRAQWVAEKIFEWAGFDAVHLRIAAFFMENIPYISGRTIRDSGRISNAFGDTLLTWISGADVGAMAAALLMDPSRATERVVLAGGVQRLTYAQIAEIATSVLGKPVRYVELTPADWREELIATSRARGQENVRGADHLVAQSIAIRQRPPSPLTNHVQDLTGAEPTLMPRFFELNRKLFA
ncbi:hypothetical protein BSN85_23080 [Bradyrhizobium brasilense]|uniref:NmrA family NAD(P)-binding protein n=1 Tax=Bradyrhizobium brasilense TaxID=1419277 RepID=UPI0009759B67|nr:NmrA family NAD(P)-binding protein [Bradyrhizobium brasilense]OMI05833.1 hypothetical protein BSN85_23080 [Bradyrhizobium brasilense]